MHNNAVLMQTTYVGPKSSIVLYCRVELKFYLEVGGLDQSACLVQCHSIMKTITTSLYSSVIV